MRNIMNVLKEVREKESEIDNLIGPIEEMYGLLLRYEVRSHAWLALALTARLPNVLFLPNVCAEQMCELNIAATLLRLSNAGRTAANSHYFNCLSLLSLSSIFDPS